MLHIYIYIYIKKKKKVSLLERDQILDNGRGICLNSLRDAPIVASLIQLTQHETRWIVWTPNVSK